MAFEGMEMQTLSVCVDCVYFNAYGRLDDMSMMDNPNAGTEHHDKIIQQWGDDSEFTSGCGRECDEHGVAAYDGDDDAYEAARDSVELEPWFSWSACEECGSHLGGDREHATVWYKPVPFSRGPEPAAMTDR